MKRPIAVALVAATIGTIGGIGATVSMGASTDTGCWDEYNLRGTAVSFATVVPDDVKPQDCTPAADCLFRYRASDGKKVRWLVPYEQDPAVASTPEDTTTTTVVTTPPPSDRFGLVGVGEPLPDDATCASRVRPMTENRPDNAGPNSVVGSSPNGRYPRVTGAFAGTTDEIIQWVACKWGVDEDHVRAQVIAESNWNQGAIGR